MAPSKNQQLRQLLDRPQIIRSFAPHDVFTARILEDAGIEMLFLGGFGVSASVLGIPDVGLTTLTEMTEAVRRMADRLTIPLVADGDTGHGDLHNVARTVRDFEKAGASGVLLEDQVAPKRCGHFSGKDVVDLTEARNRIKAAADARHDPNFLIVARTDACATQGFDAAIERAEAFIEDGADITFIEAPRSLDDIRSIPKRLAGTPQLINLVVGGKTPIIEFSGLDEMGFGLVLYANVALQGALKGMNDALSMLQAHGRVDESGPVASFEIRQNAVQKAHYDEMEMRYSE